MKKISVLLALILCACVIFAGCVNNNTIDPGADAENNVENEVVSQPENNGDETDVAPVVVNAASLKGPTSIGLVKLIDDYTLSTDSKYAFDFAIESAADAITPRIIKGELDIAAVPANLASVLYNKTQGEVVVLNINTLGVLYIVENGETVNSIEDLRGKTIYASGKGNTPEYALNYMLNANGMTPGVDVFVEFKAEHAECVAAIMAEPDAVAMLPQPFATTAQMSNNTIRIALNINEEWETASGKTLVTGVTVARKAFVEENPELVAKFMSDYKASVEFANSNVAEVAQLVEKYGIFKAAVAEKAIPYCQISYIDGDDMKAALSDYLTILSAQNTASIGGKLPNDDFYFIAE